MCCCCEPSKKKPAECCDKGKRPGDCTPEEVKRCHGDQEKKPAKDQA
jgi:hypothetical protein